MTAFLMGCEIFGWAGAPAFALAVAVSFSLGRDVGLYGRGATGILKRATSAAGAPCREEAVTAGEFVGNCPCGAACGWVSYQIVRLQKKL